MHWTLSFCAKHCSARQRLECPSALALSNLPASGNCWTAASLQRHLAACNAGLPSTNPTLHRPLAPPRQQSAAAHLPYSSCERLLNWRSLSKLAILAEDDMGASRSAARAATSRHSSSRAIVRLAGSDSLSERAGLAADSCLTCAGAPGARCAPSSSSQGAGGPRAALAGAVGLCACQALLQLLAVLLQLADHVLAGGQLAGDVVLRARRAQSALPAAKAWPVPESCAAAAKAVLRSHLQLGGAGTGPTLTAVSGTAGLRFSSGFIAGKSSTCARGLEWRATGPDCKMTPETRPARLCGGAPRNSHNTCAAASPG